MADDISTIGYKADLTGINQINKGLGTIATTGEKTEKRMNSSSQSVAKNLNLIKAALTGIVASQAISEITSLSDSWTRVNNSLKVVIDSEEQLISTRSTLLSVAKETNANLEGTVSLYSELYRNTRDLGTAESTVISVTKTLNNLFKAGGKSADETAGAIRQLSQGLASGALRGDEFNSVAEGAPRILDALSESLGISKGELRDFAATGGITSGILIDALSAYSTEAQRLADITNETYEQNLTTANTNLTEFIGNNNTVTEATEAFGESIVYLSENLDGLVDAGKGAVTVYGAYAALQGGKALSSTIAMVAATAAERKELIASTAATVANTKAEISNLAVQKQGLTNSIARVTSERARVAMRTQLTSVTVAQTAAEARLATATEAYAVAAGTATVASRALSTATSFLLGPWGLLLTAVGTAAAIFATAEDSSDNLSESLDSQKLSVDELAKKYEKLNDQQRANILMMKSFELQAITKEINQLNQELMLTQFDDNAITSLTVKQTERLQALTDQAAALRAEMDAIANPVSSDVSGGTNFDDSWIRQLINAVDPAAKIRAEIEKVNKALEANAITSSQASKRIAQLNMELFNTENAGVSDLAAQYYVYGEALANIGTVSEKYSDSLTRARDEEAKKAQESKDAYDAWVMSVENAADPARKLKEEIEDIYLAMASGDVDWDLGIKRIDQLEGEVDALNDNPFDSFVSGASEAVTGLQSLAETGTSAYEDLTTAAMTLSAVQQAMSGNYIGAAISGVSALMSLGGELEDISMEVQAAQGLDDWGEKADSISSATEITANATEDLVGINTDMLDALTTLGDSITSASSIISGDVSYTTPSVDTSNILTDIGGFWDDWFTGIGDIFGDNILGDLFSGIGGLFDGIIGSLFGGSSKVKDEGIQIIGNTLGNLIDDTMVLAYQSVSYKKWSFGSTKTKTAYEDISNDVGAQFSLVFESLADAVYAGATGIGLDSASVEKAIQKFTIDTIEISLKDLSADEQAAEIEAVFSDVFNDLAESVVPWLSKLQDAGEELGATLSRVATEVAIADYLVDVFGVTFGDKMSNPKAYAKAADNLATLAGGVESLSDSTASFIDAFASDEKKIEILGNALTESLNGVGLSVPETVDGMLALMETLDGSTAEGQEQIATLLNLTDTAESYYDLLSDTQESMADLSDTFAEAIMDIYGMTDAVAQVSLDAALAAARLGDFSLAEQLDVSDYTLDTSDFGTLAEYNVAQAQAANKLLELSQLSSDASGSVETQQLDELKAQNKLLLEMKYADESIAKTNAKMASDINRMLNIGIPTYE